MKNKLQITLISACITLFINNVYADTSNAAACNQAYANGDNNAALKLATQALGRNKNDKDVLICQGRALIENGDANTALAAFKAAEAASDNALDKTIAILLTGHAYKEAKQYEPALASYTQSIAQAKLAKSAAFQRVGYNAIGDAYVEQKQLPLALNAYTEGAALAANDNERGESFERIAAAHHSMGQHDQALEFQVKAFLMHQKVGTLDQYAHSSIALGQYQLAAKDYISAESTLNKIIKFAKDQGGAYYEAQGSYVLAQVKHAKGDSAAAKTLVEYAKSIASKTHDQALADEIAAETKDIL